MKEVVSLATANGYPTKPTIIEEKITATEKMDAYKTSMLLDYENHRDLEIDSILTKRHGILTVPVLTFSV